VRFLEQMKKRLETIHEEDLVSESGQDADEDASSLEPMGKNEYIAHVRTRLNAWIKEFDKLEEKAYQAVLDQECQAQIDKLDQRLSEGFERMRDLMATSEEDWDGIKEEAETLWQDILTIFDHVRECVSGESAH